MRKKSYRKMVDALKGQLNQNQTNSTLGAMDAEMISVLRCFVLVCPFGGQH